jgi:hypothetical protein
MTNIESKIEAIGEQLERADIPTNTIFNASQSLGALIFAISYLVEIVQEQEQRIEHLEEVLQNHMEGR